MPATTPVSAEYLSAQTLLNCEFFSQPDAVFTIVTSKEPLGNIKAFVLKSEDGQREVFLSESGPTVQEALQAVHLKSAEAVQQYINTNGFEFVPELKKRSSKGRVAENDNDNDNDSALSGSLTSTITCSEAASTYESLSDDETVSITSGVYDKTKKRSGRKATNRRKHHEGHRNTRRSRSPSQSRLRSRSRSRSSSRSVSRVRATESDDDEGMMPPQRRPSPVLPATRIFDPRLRGIPPPPPPGWAAPLPPPPPTFLRMPTVPGTGIVPPPPPLQQPGNMFPGGHPAPAAPRLSSASSPIAQQQPVPPKPTSSPVILHDVRLHIRWRGHGDQRVLEQARPSVRGIGEAALAYVRRNAPAFGNVTTFDTAPNRLWSLRPTVRRATIDGDSYDMSNFAGDDLRRLIDASSTRGIPLFEVDIESPCPVGLRNQISVPVQVQQGH